MPIAAHRRVRNSRKTDTRIETGRELREKGMALSASKQVQQIRRGMVAMLSAMLERDDLTGTADDIAADLDRKYEDGGHWVGSVTSNLLNRSLIEFIGYTKSARRSRHSGVLGQYRIVDPHQARGFIASLNTAKSPSSPQSDCLDDYTEKTTTNLQETNHAP